MSFVRFLAPLLIAALCGVVFSGQALAGCTTTGTIAFSIDCNGDFGPNATASTSGTLTVDGETIDDPNDGANSFSRIVLKAGNEAGGAIDIGIDLTGITSVESHNSAAVYGLTKQGDITINIGADVYLDAQQSGVFAKADNATVANLLGGDVVVTNYGTIDAGTLLNGSLGSEGIRVRALQGVGTIYNYGSVTSLLGRGLRIDGSALVGYALDDLIVNNGKVDAALDAIHVNAVSGKAEVQNGVDGEVTSRDQRGVVASSTYNSASLKNDGKITADAAGALVWGGKDATLTNSGTITAATDNDLDANNDYLNFGVQIWSTDEGTAKLINNEGAAIIAHDGWAAWLMSTDGDVMIDNAGRLTGKSTAIYVGADNLAEQWVENPQDVPDYEGAVGGDLTLTNSGVITADETTDFTNGMALITLTGRDLIDVSVTNHAAGFIGAGFAEDTDFSFDALRALNPSELDSLDAAANNAALSLAIDAETSTIANEGTLVGRVAVASPHDIFGVGPTSSIAGALSNSGLWVTSGESGYTGSMSGVISNSGDIFTLGQTTLVGTLENSGTIWVNATANNAADLTINGSYNGSGSAALAFNVGAGAYTSGDPLVTLTGDVSGQTKVALVGLDAWDWKSGVTLDLIDAESGTPELGADSFVLTSPPVIGLVQYNLNYDDTELLWSFSTEVSQQSVSDITALANVVSTSALDISSDLLMRTDDLRDEFWSGGESEPMAYAAAAAPTSSAGDAISDALTADRLPTLRTWTRMQGAAGVAGDYRGQQGTLTFGADIAADVSDAYVAAGVFGAISNTSLSYDTPGNTVGIRGQALGVYGTAMWNSGLFASGTLAVENTSIDLGLSGASASFDAGLQGGRVDVGYRTQLGELDIEPSVALSYGQTQYDDFEMSNTIVSLDQVDTLAEEARLRITQTFTVSNATVVPFVVLSLGHRGVDDGTVTMSDLGAVGALDDGGIYGGVSTGLQVKSLDGSLSGFLRADTTVSEQSLWGTVKVGGSYNF